MWLTVRRIVDTTMPISLWLWCLNVRPNQQEEIHFLPQALVAVPQLLPQLCHIWHWRALWSAHCGRTWSGGIFVLTVDSLSSALFCFRYQIILSVFVRKERIPDCIVLFLWVQRQGDKNLFLSSPNCLEQPVRYSTSVSSLQSGLKTILKSK